MTYYNLRSRGSSHGANVVLVDDYLREWRQAQRDYVPPRHRATPTRTKSIPKQLKLNGSASACRVGNSGGVCNVRDESAEMVSADRPARTRCVSENFHAVNSQRRARSMGISVDQSSHAGVNTLRSRSGSKSKLRRAHLDIDMLSESFSAHAKIKKLDTSKKRDARSVLPVVANGKDVNEVDGYSGMELDDAGSDQYLITSYHFLMLPVDCKLKIFSYLSAGEKGLASLVCQDWNQLMKEPTLWSTIDFTQFQLCQKRHDCGNVCYEAYKTRIQAFVTRLRKIRPVIKRFAFHYDIGNVQDGWLDCMEDVIVNSNCRELTYAHLDWKETPVRPFWKDCITWSNSQYKDMLYSARRRQRKFARFFENVVSKAPNITHLIMPFDWSYRSVSYVSRLSKLKVLVLEKYMFFQSPPLNHLEDLLRSCSQLEKLVLEVWSGSAKGMYLYRLSSQSLKHLDISQCRGFYLQTLDLPNLETFKCDPRPLHGPLSSPDTLKLPCIYDLLVSGAPNLKRLNDHRLHADWRHLVNNELLAVLRKNCWCNAHR